MNMSGNVSGVAGQGMSKDREKRVMVQKGNKTLKHFATGDSYKSLMYRCRVSHHFNVHPRRMRRYYRGICIRSQIVSDNSRQWQRQCRDKANKYGNCINVSGFQWQTYCYNLSHEWRVPIIQLQWLPFDCVAGSCR